MLFCFKNFLRTCPCMHLHVLTLYSLLVFGAFFPSSCSSSLPILESSCSRTLQATCPALMTSVSHFSTHSSFKDLSQPQCLHTSIPPGPKTLLLQQQSFQTLMKHLCLRFSLTGIRLLSELIFSPLSSSSSLQGSLIYHFLPSLPSPADTSPPPKSTTFLLQF